MHGVHALHCGQSQASVSNICLYICSYHLISIFHSKPEVKTIIIGAVPDRGGVPEGSRLALL